MTTTTYKPGDEVEVYKDHHDKSPSGGIVHHVTKRTIVLVGGRKYDLDGIAWGQGKCWFHEYIKKVEA